MKKTAFLLLAMALIVSLCACGEKNTAQNEETIGGTTMTPNPMTEVSFTDVETALGQEIHLPEDAAVDQCFTIGFSGDLLYEVRFSWKGCDYCYRFQKTEEPTDISGMYYSWQSQVTQEEPRVLLASEGAGLTTWYQDGFSFALSVSENADKEAITDLYFKLL